jgi:hypothetical protein
MIKDTGGVLSFFFKGFILVGALFGGYWAVAALARSVRLSLRGRRVKGKVVSIEAEGSGRRSARIVTVAYTVAGEKYALRYWTGAFAVGQEVTVLHARHDPTGAQVMEWATRWMLPLLMLAPITAIIGCVIAYWALKK